jgi:hypothetical protein
VIDNTVITPAHFMPDVPGDYAVVLTVTDNGGFSTQQTQIVHAQPCLSGPTLAGLTS